ncbi:MOSC domain-containing protein [Oceanobacillus sp. FSL K6-2867]|uniref:MOSC domain-containing protein n=1 Tax=Oceanobacillus sp. FSL K6-2867 TaxID=2954748 RepID=UPI0030D966FF
MEEPYVHKIFLNNKEIQKPFSLQKTGFLRDTESGEVAKSKLDKAIFAYPIKHYTDLQEIGTNGEHFAVLEMDEFTVFIGDTFKIGDAVIQVSQPGPMSRQQLQNGLQTGWYFRVIQEGLIQGATDFELLERPYPEWSIAACTEVVYLHQDDFRAADDLYACDALGDIWRRTLQKRLRGF